MNRTMESMRVAMLLWLVVATVLVAPARAQDPPDADGLVRQMSTFLASQKAFHLQADIAFDDVPVQDLRVQYSGTMEVWLRRPDGLAAHYVDDLTERRIWVNDEMATVLLPDENHWAQTEAEPSVNATLDVLAESYGISIPLDDFFLDDPYSVLMGGAVRTRYIGESTVGGVLCHHILVGQEDINWQVWIAMGESPLPRQMVITYKNLPMAPDFSALIRAWDLDPQLSRDQFTASIPAGANQIDFMSVEETRP